MELLEYVRRKATFPGPSIIPLLIRVFVCGTPLNARVGRVVRPLDEPEDTVSIESVPCSNEDDIVLGMGGIGSAGARYPFFVADIERELPEKRFLALGADATRRMNRVADAPIALGDRGPAGRDVDGVEGPNEASDGCAV
jgi:hypothetical protein